MSIPASDPPRRYGLRPGAEEFPLMTVISIIYPCNFGCPFCPYTDENSDLRKSFEAFFDFRTKGGSVVLPPAVSP